MSTAHCPAANKLHTVPILDQPYAVRVASRMEAACIMRVGQRSAAQLVGSKHT